MAELPNMGDVDHDPTEEELEDDCYFPKDGYNYEKHLRRVNRSSAAASVKPGEKIVVGGGAAGVVMEAPVKIDEQKINLQPAQTTEEAELLRALECVDEYDEMEDGTIDTLVPGAVVEPDLVLWGPTALENANHPDLATFKAAHKARLAALMGVDENDFEDIEVEEEVEEDMSEEEDEQLEENEVKSKSAASSTGKKKKSKPVVQAGDPEFDAFLAAEYGDDDVGACDEDDIQGKLTLEACEACCDQYLEDKKTENAKLQAIFDPQAPKKKDRLDDVPRVIEETKAIIEKHYLGEESETSSGEESEEEKEQWDCETVLSNLSNLSNRPGKIGKIKAEKKPKAMKTLREGDEEESEESEEECVELPDVITERKKDETPEEKRERKRSVKAMQKLCREMKKQSKLTFKGEAMKLKDRNTGTGDVSQKLRKFHL